MAQQQHIAVLAARLACANFPARLACAAPGAAAVAGAAGMAGVASGVGAAAMGTTTQLLLYHGAGTAVEAEHGCGWGCGPSGAGAGHARGPRRPAKPTW
ncbi:MAG: hypothetical protein CMJ89_05940 [Planctomycetes bacterium]|nr:hypothetical protein [Planctomycetota bacterium]